MSTNLSLVHFVDVCPNGEMLSKREILWLRHEKKCHWCGCLTFLTDDNSWDKATIDHVLPRYKGGSNEYSNLVSACYRCNNRRSHEDQRGLPEGSLLGNYKVNSTLRKTCLTKEEKDKIKGKVSAHDVVVNQRDQALKQIGELNREIYRINSATADLQRTLKETETELKIFHKIVEDQKKEIESMSIRILVRKKVAYWLSRHLTTLKTYLE
jgi:hypothetical protein